VSVTTDEITRVLTLVRDLLARLMEDAPSALAGDTCTLAGDALTLAGGTA
jgi:hypothetical protein